MFRRDGATQTAYQLVDQRIDFVMRLRRTRGRHIDDDMQVAVTDMPIAKHVRIGPPRLDLALYALNHGYSAAELGEALKLSELQAQQVFNDILAKRKATRYMHLKPQLVEAVKELNLP